MLNFPVPNKSLSGFQNFPSPSKLRWGFPDFRSSVIQKKGEISDWLGTWQYRIPLTIDSTKIDSDLTYFPVPIVLTGTDAGAVITEVGSANKKIAVGLPDQSQLYCEIEQWDAVNDKITLWVSRSDWVISSAADTTLYLYYDGAQDDNLDYVGDPGDAAAQNVWNSNILARYSMAQDPSGGAGSIIDSTSNSHDGTPVGSMTTSDLVDADIGKGIDFDGTNDSVTLPNSSAIVSDFTNFGIIVRAKLDANNGKTLTGNRLVSIDSATLSGHAIALGVSSGLKIGITFYTGSFSTYEGQSVSLGTDYSFAYKKTGTSHDVFLDGSKHTTTFTGTPYNPGANPAHISLDYTGSGDRYWDGIVANVMLLDEVSDDWIKADYHAQTNTLLTAGTPQEYNG